MDKDALIKKRSQKESRFDTLVEEKAKIEEELVKLQGEYRALTELIDELDKKPVSPYPDTLDVDAALGIKSKKGTK